MIVGIGAVYMVVVVGVELFAKLGLRHGKVRAGMRTGFFSLFVVVPACLLSTFVFHVYSHNLRVANAMRCKNNAGRKRDR